MQSITFTVTPKTEHLSLLRRLDHVGQPNERELDNTAIKELTAVVDQYYQRQIGSHSVLGQHLYQWLDGPTERWLAQVATHAEGTAVLIDVAEQLRHLPWELLNQQGLFLCQNATHPFTPVRLLPQNNPRQHQRANRPLRLLFMACSAEDIKPVLHYEYEEGRILKAAGRNDIELVVEERGSLAGLEERLSDYGDDEGKGYFDVLHLTGHADVDKKTKEPFFWMENDLGYGEKVTAEQLKRAFVGNWPRLVFLSGCKTAQASEAGLLPSFCEALVAAGAPAVLGWALPVVDEYATQAAAELYQHLAAGKRLDEAVARARFHLLDNRMDDWHLLRLYADRTPLAELVTPLRHKGRTKIKTRSALSEWLDENRRSEVCPREEFSGRRRPLQRCLRAPTSRESDAHYTEGVLIHGMGGLGKSSLAARLCDRLPDYRRFFWYGALADELSFTSKLGEKLGNVEVNQLLAQPLPLKQRLRQLFASDVFNIPSLFIFDDFEQNLEPDVSGAYQAKAAPLEILKALLGALYETGSDSRVIVTSRYRFPLPHPLWLHEEGLESLSDADLAKKLRQLSEKFTLRLAQGDAQYSDLLKRTEALGAGNPRLLERLYRVLADAATDHEAIFAALENKTAEFREEILLRQLLERQTPAGRQLVALAAVCRLPVDQAALAAIADVAFDAGQLERAVMLGLIEAGTVANPQTGGYEARYFVSDLLLPLLADPLAHDVAHAAQQRAAQHLFQFWWVGKEFASFTRVLEIHRLALLAGEQEIAAQLGAAVSSTWYDKARFREAEAICLLTLVLGKDYRVLHQLANAEAVLGSGKPVEYYHQALAACPANDPKERGSILHSFAVHLDRQGEVERALELWQEALALADQEGDIQSKAATQHAMACALVKQGDAGLALKLWHNSLNLTAQIGDVQGKAAIMNEMANLLAQQGEMKQAMRLWQGSLELTEKFGNAYGKAKTLANLAWAAGTSGDAKEERRLNLEAAQAFVEVRAWPDLIGVLWNLSTSNGEDTIACLAQALWLASRIGVSLEMSIKLAAELLRHLGPTNELASLLAAGAMSFVNTRGENHPERELYKQIALGMLSICTQARGIETQEALDEWVEREGLLDPERFVPQLDAALVAMVGDGEWLFDRRLF
jgi:tetratricopeptide (TPR) repeat protein